MKLLEPFVLGDLVLPNRIVMAPMTRNRSVGQVQSSWAVEHYSARATAGLIIGEATQVSPRGQGSADTPGLYDSNQVAAWKAVTDAVHGAGGRMVAQVSHAGRLSHSDYHGLPPVAPSSVLPSGFIRTPRGTKAYEEPWVPTTAEVATLVDEFGRSAALAREAGFDGIEVHGAHGFLIDQFLQSGTNLRQDRYGVTPAGRRRFLWEVLEAVRGSWPISRVGLTLSPTGNHKGIRDEDPVGTFTSLVTELGRLGLGWLHVADFPLGDVRPSEFLRPVFPGPLIVSEGYTRETAEEVLQAGGADLVAFGRAFTANPDLVERFRTGTRLNHEDPKTFYAGGRTGYLDTVTKG